ncbi:hypothetical protein Acr_10g0007410 [Actinidia rufa]|uniref:Reverse transcriptase domain-containing protein n=1 Tax=Actinidia rufa TaxID=165716 RepID=A0A7J0FA98_9ERIC|nr:hypothetical protein Acr_10g0007410 [Actinidia rufa]
MLPPLNAPIVQVLTEIKNEDVVKYPRKIKTNPLRRNKNKYCEFHKDHGHNTEYYFQLNEQIVNLIKGGYLRKFVTVRPRPDSPDRGYTNNRPTTCDFQTIHGGFGLGGCSTSSWKRHAREANGRIEEEVYNLSTPMSEALQSITFTNDFYLPKIDLIVDTTFKHELLNFMDAFSGYHQIKMNPPDIEKTSFITERGLYCYKVMPFELKNARATYQRLVNRMYEEMIGKIMEVYIDDMLVKSLKADDHVANLKKTFDIL